MGQTLYCFIRNVVENEQKATFMTDAAEMRHALGFKLNQLIVLMRSVLNYPHYLCSFFNLKSQPRAE